MLRAFYKDHIEPVQPKLLYFLFFLGYGFAFPYYPLMLQQLMNPDLVGLTMGMLQLCTFVGSIFWGFMQDLLGRPRFLISSVLLCGLGLRCALFFVGPSFWLPLAIMVVSELVFSGCIPLTDAFVLNSLKDRSRSDLFGKQRVHGAVGWGVAALISGIVFEHISLTYGLFFSLFVSLFVVLTLFLGSRHKKTEKENEEERIAATVPKVGVMEALRRTKLTWQQKCFFGSVFFAGASMSTMNIYLFLYLKTLGGTELLFGLSLVAMIVSEIPFMFYAGVFQRKLGTFTIVMSAFFCYFLRFVGYTWLPLFNPWLVLILEPLHGITFGVFYSSAISYVHSLSRKETVGTLQGLFNGIVSFGRAFGSIGGGFLYKSGGGFRLFLVGSGVMFVVTALFGLVVLTDRGFVKEESEEEIEDEAVELINVETTTKDLEEVVEIEE